MKTLEELYRDILNGKMGRIMLPENYDPEAHLSYLEPKVCAGCAKSVVPEM